MINWFELFAVAFGIANVVLVPYLFSQMRENKQLRTLCDRLASTNIEAVAHCDALEQRNDQLRRANIANETYLAAASDLLTHCQELERRNEHLEALFANFKDSVAGARLMMPRTLDVTERFTVRQGSEMP